MPGNDDRFFIFVPLMLLLLHGCSLDGTRMTKKTRLENATMVPMPATIQQRYDKALKLLEGDKVRAAIPLLKEVTTRVPDRYGPWINLGLAYTRDGRSRDAEASVKRALQLEDEHPSAWNLLGILARRRGAFDDAEKAYRRALELNPGYARAELNLGILMDLYRLRPEVAIKHYQRFQGLNEKPDPIVAKWIAEIRLRLKASGKYRGRQS